VEQILGLVYTICFISCYWPQIIKCIRTKSVEDVSLLLFALSIVGYISAMGYTVIALDSDFWLLINYGLSLLSAVVMLCVWFRYKK